jgi:hypothetical protein
MKNEKDYISKPNSNKLSFIWFSKNVEQQPQ